MRFIIIGAFIILVFCNSSSQQCIVDTSIYQKILYDINFNEGKNFYLVDKALKKLPLNDILDNPHFDHKYLEVDSALLSMIKSVNIISEANSYLDDECFFIKNLELHNVNDVKSMSELELYRKKYDIKDSLGVHVEFSSLITVNYKLFVECILRTKWDKRLYAYLIYKKDRYGYQLLQKVVYGI
jgi:hypothetical protein